MSGWIKLHRAIENSIVWKDAELLKLWMHLLINAKYQPTKELVGKSVINLTEGQLVVGRKKLSSITGIHESKIFRLLKLLESEQQIEQQTNSRYSIITIKNWGLYQQDEQQDEQQMNSKRTTNEQQMNTIKEIKNIRNKEINNKLSNDNLFVGSSAELADARTPANAPPVPEPENATNVEHQRNIIYGGIDEKINQPAEKEALPVKTKPRKTDDVPYQAIEALYNEICTSLPRSSKLTESRKTHIKNRWQDDKKHQDLNFWKKFFQKVESSDFLTGRSKAGWRVTAFEWLVNPANFLKIIEGAYDNKTNVTIYRNDPDKYGEEGLVDWDKIIKKKKNV